MEKEESSLNNDINAYPPKKKIDVKNQNDLDFIQISTNLSQIELNVKAINGVYLFGCDIEEEKQISQDPNPVNTMRKARKCKCFQEELKKYVSNYYISGLVLMGKPINDTKKFKFYLKTREIDKVFIDPEIFESKPKNIEKDEKVFKFKFKRKKKDLSEMKEEDNESGDAQCVANYLNICLGKILKRCGYTKDRTTRKILYYNKQDAEGAQRIGKSDYLYFPALKAVCETYEEGKIYMKLLPKKLLRTSYSYEDYFYSLQEKYPHSNFEEIFKIFTTNVVQKRGIKIYDQSLIKIEEIIYENPYEIYFKDRNEKKWNVGDYYNEHWNINLDNQKTLLAVRNVDKGGKLKGADILKMHIPCCVLQIVGNIFGDTINIKDMVQSPSEKFDEIYYVRNLIKKNAIKSEEDKLNSYLGDKFDPVTVDGQVIMPPLIKFGEDINHKNQMVEVTNGSFDLMGTSPYSKIKELKKIDIYFLDIDLQQGGKIWEKLKEAGKNLGITFQEEPTFYEIENFKYFEEFDKYLNDYFKKCDEHYKDKKNNETDFIFMFMDYKKKTTFHYRVFKSVINKFNWSIPTQVILYNEKKMNSSNLSQFTNILCQMWAKKGNELYACDFSFIPKTMVIAYSSMVVQKNEEKNVVLTSLSISIGATLYEYMFFSKIEENKSKDSIISPSIESLFTMALTAIGKHLKKGINNIVIYRDAVNEKQQKNVKVFEINTIQKAINAANEKLEKKVFKDTKWCLILVSKINEVKLFLERQNGGNNYEVRNVPVGTIVDSVITHKDKYDFYLNSAETRQGTASSTHYTILHDDTSLEALQIYKLTYYLTYLSYNTTHSIRVPAPLYFVTRRNKFTSENLRGDIINPKSRTLNISL
jgi:hypothetical protein